MSDKTIDSTVLRAKQGLLAGFSIGAHVSAMIYVGMKLGLYAAMRGAGPMTSETLAASTGLHERWLREWLRGQAAGTVLDYDAAAAAFTLSAEMALLLADPDHLLSMESSFAGLTYRFGVLDRLPEAFRSGIGIASDDRGPDAAAASETNFRNWYRQVLVPVALPMLDGVVVSLDAGGAAADVGCGTGIAMIEMAKRFPRAQFHGYEASQQAIKRGRGYVDAADLPNITFHDVAIEPLPPQPAFDLITTFDCLHDMTQPHAVALAIRAAIKPGGSWFIADINGAPTFEENLRRTRMAALFYAVSVMSCMSSAMSEPDGAGYGTLGLPEPEMQRLVERAGFSRFRRVDLPHPINAYYEARL
ncbi:MAG: class I SAM-dependent methyltransferase [Chloroflexota bacterium]|nr:class I SAM-dependent methyltransferase [Chloroflexota bacterium]